MNRSSDSSLIMEDRLKVVIEENVGLKSYIDNMNKECLELNAALFEEANKLVTTALAKQSIAEKKLKEKTQENDMLRSQIQSLREVIAKLPSPVETVSPTTPIVKNTQKRFSSASRHRKSRPPDLQSTPTLFRKSCENLSLMVASGPGSALTAVSRSDLFAALLAEEADADETDRITFLAFCDWIRAGCPLSLGLQNDERESELAANTLKSSSTGRRPPRISRSYNVQSINDSESDHGQVSSTQHTDSAAHETSVAPFDQFLSYLLEFDIKPCLLFKNTEITEAIYQALADQNLEITPLTRFFDSSQSRVTHEYGKYCPLLPPLQPRYQLSIENVPCVVDGKPGTRTLVVNISTEARNRIAAVVSLFQYLKLVSRRCGSTSSLSDLGSPVSKSVADPLAYLDHSTIEKQFAKIQRLRLGIAFARLGFGIPETE